ncbi:MAG: hypothetical protein ACFCUW_11195 [Kiloniellaceae bacterium]
MGALTLVGTLLSAAGSLAAGRADARAAEFNAAMAQQQAVRERDIARREAEDHRRRHSRLLATARARRAGSGVTSEGSPLMVDEAGAAEIELGAQDILAGGAAAAQRHRQSAAFHRARAGNARNAGLLRAGTTLLTAANRGGSGGFFEL